MFPKRISIHPFLIEVKNFVLYSPVLLSRYASCKIMGILLSDLKAQREPARSTSGS